MEERWHSSTVNMKRELRLLSPRVFSSPPLADSCLHRRLRTTFLWLPAPADPSCVLLVAPRRNGDERSLEESRGVRGRRGALGRRKAPGAGKQSRRIHGGTAWSEARKISMDVDEVRHGLCLPQINRWRCDEVS